MLWFLLQDKMKPEKRLEVKFENNHKTIDCIRLLGYW